MRRAALLVSSSTTVSSSTAATVGAPSSSFIVENTAVPTSSSSFPSSSSYSSISLFVSRRYQSGFPSSADPFGGGMGGGFGGFGGGGGGGMMGGGGEGGTSGRGSPIPVKGMHPDFEMAIGREKEIRKSYSTPHIKGGFPSDSVPSNPFSTHAKDRIGDGMRPSAAAAKLSTPLSSSSSSSLLSLSKGKINSNSNDSANSSSSSSDFEVLPPMMEGSGLAAGKSTKEDASQGMAAAVANIFETEQRYEELRKTSTTTRIVDRRRLVVDKVTGEVIARRTDEEVAASRSDAASEEQQNNNSIFGGGKKKKKGFFGTLFGGKKDAEERRKEADRRAGISAIGKKFTTNIDEDEDARAVSSSADAAAAAAAATGRGKKYRFFEDQYPKHAPEEVAHAKYEYYEEMEAAAKVKCEEDKGPGLNESEKLHKAHEWEIDKEKGYVPDKTYGWAEEWGPEPGEEGHKEWYKKNRMYMSYEEKSRLDLKNGVPLEKNQFRHHEMPLSKRMKDAYTDLAEERGAPELKPMSERSYDAAVGFDEKDLLMKTRDEYMKEWLAKPGVTPETMAKKIGEYNGTAKKQNVKPVLRKPEWELAPIVEE